MRLQKYLARCGIGSRRHCEALMAEGRVSVNGRAAVEMGTKVVPGADAVLVDGTPAILPNDQATFMLHKPAGFVTTMHDPQGRPTVAELVPVDRHPSLFSVGRLDADTTGLLLFTTDGELGHQLMHPRFHVAKRYVVLAEGDVGEDAMERLRAGVMLEDGPTAPAVVHRAEEAEARRWAAEVGCGRGASGLGRRHGGRRSRAVLEPSGTWLSVEIAEGRNRQVRRMMEAVGHPVIALHRQTFGPLSLGRLPRGDVRQLSGEEVQLLRQAVRARSDEFDEP